MEDFAYLNPKLHRKIGGGPLCLTAAELYGLAIFQTAHQLSGIELPVTGQRIDLISYKGTQLSSTSSSKRCKDTLHACADLTSLLLFSPAMQSDTRNALSTGADRSRQAIDAIPHSLRDDCNQASGVKAA